MAASKENGAGRSGGAAKSKSPAKAKSTPKSKSAAKTKSTTAAKSTEGAKSTASKSRGTTAPKGASKSKSAGKSAAGSKARGMAAEQVAHGYFEALARRDPDEMAGYWSAEGVEDIVPVGIYRGPDEVRGFFTQLFAAIPDLESVVERVTADDRVAVVQWRMSGSFDGTAFLGVDATGRRVELRGADCIEVEDGRITRNTAYYDGMAFARGAGMMPPQDSSVEKAMFSAFNTLTKARGALRDARR